MVAHSDEIVRYYTESGWPIRKIAKHYQRSYGCVRDLLVEAGVIMRPQGGHRPKKKA